MAVFTVGGVLIYKASKTKATNQTVADSSQNTPGQNGRGNWQGGQRGNRVNFQPVQGTIQSIDNSTSTIVMKASDNSVKNVTCSSSTRIMKTDNGTRQTLAITDLKPGDQINVVSSDNTQATIAARMIIIGQLQSPQNRGSSQDQNSNTDGNNSQSST